MLGGLEILIRFFVFLCLCICLCIYLFFGRKIVKKPYLLLLRFFTNQLTFLIRNSKIIKKGDRYGEGRKGSFSDGSVVFCGFALPEEASQGISSSHQEDAIGVSERSFGIPIWAVCQNGLLRWGAYSG